MWLPTIISMYSIKKMKYLTTVYCLIIVHNVFCSSATDINEILNVFENSGYSPVCIANALISCKTPSLTVKIKKDTNVSQIQETLIKSHPINCAELLDLGDTTSGVRTVYPYDCCRDKKVIVFCDQTTDGGGWTVFQNRDAFPVREDFYRTWVEYVLGFGNATGEFWLGLDHIHALESSSLMEMRVDLEDYEGNNRWAKYGAFYIGDASTKYTLRFARYSGDAGDGFTNAGNIDGTSLGMKFSTHDQDNDLWPGNCAVSFRGAWWFRTCHHSDLNGYQYVGQHATHADGINWYPFKEWSYSLKKASMKIRPAFKT